MIKRLAGLLVAGAMLAGCGTVSAGSAVSNWVSQSGFHSTNTALLSDAAHAATALRSPNSLPRDLHTVCGVLLVDTQAANASLPTPDNQATNLLGLAYTNIGAGANECYKADFNTASRQRAIASMIKGVGELAEAKARLASLASN